MARSRLQAEAIASLVDPVPSLDSTGRFSDRVADYVRFRPTYPRALVEWLREDHGVTPSWMVADVGAGTGISARLFLEAGHEVIAVEPNAAMRTAAVEALGGSPRFRAVDAPAEATTLPGASVDLVVAAQAFHWFQPEAVRREWARILRPGRLALVVWNSRRTGGTPFLDGYEQLLREHSTDYAAVAERYADEATMRRWFGAGFREARSFENQQVLDLDGLRGRLLSSSYAPRPGHPGHEPMLEALGRLFERTAVDGHVIVEYETRGYVGTLVPDPTRPRVVSRADQEIAARTSHRGQRQSRADPTQSSSPS
jgi:SAM-dependent methyltransferase